jgi:hypothetical protein
VVAPERDDRPLPDVLSVGSVGPLEEAFDLDGPDPSKGHRPVKGYPRDPLAAHPRVARGFDLRAEGSRVQSPRRVPLVPVRVGYGVAGLS